MISVNGAAAHKAQPGDRVIICTYAQFEQAELASFEPRLVYCNIDNSVSHSANAIPVQVA